MNESNLRVLRLTPLSEIEPRSLANPTETEKEASRWLASFLAKCGGVVSTDLAREVGWSACGYTAEEMEWARILLGLVREHTSRAIFWRYPDGPSPHPTAGKYWTPLGNLRKLIHPPPGRPSIEIAVAADWLWCHLVSMGGASASATVKEAARDEGIAVATLQRARRKLGVVLVSEGRRTLWKLPD